MHRLLLRLSQDRAGGAVVEFALLAPLVLTVLLGGLDFGRLFYARQGLEYATEEAARYYMLNPSTASSAISTYLQGRMPGGMGPSVNVSYADTASCNGNVTCTTITATYSFSFGAYLALGTTTLTATSKAVRYTGS
jgi:Flp pilus assembly protein TadG